MEQEGFYFWVCDATVLVCVSGYLQTDTDADIYGLIYKYYKCHMWSFYRTKYYLERDHLQKTIHTFLFILGMHDMDFTDTDNR